MRLARRGFVYIVRSGLRGPVKVGFSEDPSKRIAGLQTSHAEDLRVLLTIPGTENDESDLHHRFRRSRIRGEWFEYGPEIRAYIEEVRRMPGACTPLGPLPPATARPSLASVPPGCKHNPIFVPEASTPTITRYRCSKCRWWFYKPRKFSTYMLRYGHAPESYPWFHQFVSSTAPTADIGGVPQ